MEAIKIIEDVTSDSITIKNLSRFKGKKVEIILLPFEESDEKSETEKSISVLFGTMKSDIDGIEFQNKSRGDWKE
ncbi:MAG: hypothetical protein JXJ04_05570 [Spirochaetales bacterium]|nr:hypothetical protein [Spirochaetales bacterium]